MRLRFAARAGVCGNGRNIIALECPAGCCGRHDARSHPDPEVRRKALFWLGQSGDPRALALFEELLTKP